MNEQRGGDPVAIYWESVTEVAAGPEGPKRDRAVELLRLRKLADRYRQQFFPKLPAVTIDVANMSGRSSAAVDPLGGWGQGISIKVKATRVDPFRWDHQILITRIQDHGAVRLSKDRSLLFGHPLRMCPGGEKLRAFEAELLVLQQLLRAEQHRCAEERDLGFDEARGDLQNWGGNGRWFAQNASRVWQQWCAERGVPFVPCRHSRAGYEAEQKTIFDIEEIDEDRPFTALRPSCSTWPASCMGATRDPIAQGECPKPFTIGDSVMAITPELWDRWKVEQGRLVGAVHDLIGRDAIQYGVKWPTAEQPVIDEVEGETIVALPVISKPKPTSTKVTIGFEAEQAAQALEHVLKTAQRDHGYSGLWKSTLAVLANHKDSPGATRVQTELDIAPSDEAPTPIDAGPIRSLIEGDNSDLIRACADLYLSPDDKIADLTYGKGVFWRKCPELNVMASDLETVEARPYDFRKTPYDDGQFDVAVLDPPYIHSWSTHQTEERYRGSTTHAKGMAEIWQLYEDGLIEACRITRDGGRILVKTKDTVESGKQRWSHIHLAQVGERLGLYLRDLLVLKTNPPCEKRWEGTEQKHSRKDISYLLVFERNGQINTPTPNEAGQSWELTELDDRMFLALCQTTTVIHCRRSYVGVVDQEAAADVAVKAMGLELPPTEQVVQWGTQRMTLSPDESRSEQRGNALWNLDCMVYPTKAEAQWAYLFTQADQHRNITLESVVQRDGGWAVDDLIKETDEEQRIRLLKSEPMVQDGCDFTLEQQVRHEVLGTGVIVKLFESDTLQGNGVIELPDGQRKAVRLDELTPIETGEPKSPAPWPTTVESLTTTAQSDLRKRPINQRNRLTKAEVKALHDRLRVELQGHTGNPRQLAVRLSPELGMKVQMLTNHIRKVRDEVAA